MEVFMQGIPRSTTENKLKLELANILHGPPFRYSTDPLFNFDIYLFPNRKNRHRFRAGALTLPSAELGRQFLDIYGGPQPQRTLTFGTTNVQFQLSTKQPRPDVLLRVRNNPFSDPREACLREQRLGELEALQVNIVSVQFGWECRNHVYSIEHREDYSTPTSMKYEPDQRAFRLRMPEDSTSQSEDNSLASISRLVENLSSSSSRFILIRTAHIYWVAAGEDMRRSSQHPLIFFSLMFPPAFESLGLLAEGRPPSRRRQPSWDENCDPRTPYISLAIRLECQSMIDVENFREFAKEANLHISSGLPRVEERGVFSHAQQEAYDGWVKTLPWTVAFQIEALLRSWLVNFEEILLLRGPIQALLQETSGYEAGYVPALLQEFRSYAKQLYWFGEIDGIESDTLPSSSTWVTVRFTRLRQRFMAIDRPTQQSSSEGDDNAPFQCLHVKVTPTTMSLEGPYPERSNRVMRAYRQHQDSFLRVSIEEEDRLQLRFDADVDIRDFVNRRYRPILREGLVVAGRRFEFLAYSQSALKEHTVWFVKPFRHVDENGVVHDVDASTIIESLGDFSAIDPNLVHCPARFAARISQAFTATDASVTVEAGEIREELDIEAEGGTYVFTDGVGTISPLLAEDMGQRLQERHRRRGKKDATLPKVFQIRIQGAKGMVSVDHTLRGRTIVLRPSMIKFQGRSSTTVIEVARAFHKPGPYFLNRPLITLLEGLGVSYGIFQRLQDQAVEAANHSIESLELSAQLLERHGLGASYRLSSVMLGLYHLDIRTLESNAFWQQIMKFAINHVLRELKHHARIPVPGDDSWTLPGVADIHGELEEGQVFVCVRRPNEPFGRNRQSGGAGMHRRYKLIYLEGPVLVSRSPTIHPGDVQVVHAIGKPPPGSHLEQEPLPNTIVFSTKGTRPLPSCLGGGDLDGDEYNVTTNPDLLPERTHEPASYEPAKKKLVEHVCTMADVADFVAEYITSDTVGIIATTWLIIADQSTEGIFDPACLKLAALHSTAVDYPKSGQPVSLKEIPKLKFKEKPDWNAPETIREGGSEAYYESPRALGRLFRSITLSAPQEVRRITRIQHRHLPEGRPDELLGFIKAQFHAGMPEDTEQVVAAIRDRVSDFISTTDSDDRTITDVWELYSSYVSQLRAICAQHTLSQSRKAMLTEAEAIVGTIVAKCSQPRKRKDLMAKLREQTHSLVESMKDEIAGDEQVPSEISLQRAWAAYRLAEIEDDMFGARSFGWIALGCIFDAIREIEHEEE